MQVEELLRQLTGPDYLELDAPGRDREWQRLRALAQQQLDDDDLAGLAAADRVRGQLLLAGRPEAFRRFALAELAIRATTRCQSAWWDPDGLQVVVTGTLDRPDDPLFEVVDSRVLLRVPNSTDPRLSARQLDVTAEATAGSIALVLHEEGDESRRTDRILASGPGTLAFDETRTQLSFEVRLAVDPDQLPSGVWHSYLRIASCGWTVHAPLDLATRCPAVAVLPDRRFAAPVARPLGLVVSETMPPAALPVSRRSTGSTDVRVTRTGTHLRIGLDLALHAIADVNGSTVPLVLTPEHTETGSATGRDQPVLTERRDPVGSVRSDARLLSGSGGIGVLEASVPSHRLSQPGRYALWVDGARLGVDLVVDADGRARALAPPVLSVVGETDREFGEGLEWVPDLSAARGEYVVFGLARADVSDQTLTTLARYGSQHGAEIVLVRPPEATDPYDRPRTDIGTDSSLLGHGIPGTLYARRLLERVGLDPATDHPLVFEALAHVHAHSTAALAAVSDQLDPRDLTRLLAHHAPPGPLIGLAELETAIGSLLERTEPGPRPDAVLRRWLDEQLIARLRGTALSSLTTDQRTSLATAARRILLAYCRDQVSALAPLPRLVADLVVGDDTPDVPALVHVADWEQRLQVVEDQDVELGWQPGPVLRIRAGFRLDGVRTGPSDPASVQLGDTTANCPLSDLTAWLVLADDHGTVQFATQATVRSRITAPERDMPFGQRGDGEHQDGGGAEPDQVAPCFDLWASTDLGSVLGHTLPPGVWQLRFGLDCFGVTRYLDPTARTVDLPGGERRSRASARFPDHHLALAVGIDVDGSVELLRVPTPHVRTKGPLRRLIHRFTAQRRETRRNS